MDKMFAKGKLSSFSRGQEVPFDQVVHYVVSGAVGVYSIIDGKRRFNFVHGEHDVFPYSDIPALQPARVYIFIALTKVTLLSLPRKTFQKLTLKPQYAKPVIEKMTQTMLLQGRRIDDLQQQNVLARLLDRLLFLAERLGSPRGQKIIIDVPISHVDLASSIGSTRETVNRYMKQMEQRDILTVHRQKITITSLEALQQVIKTIKSRNVKDLNLLPFVAVTTLVAENLLNTAV